MKLEDKVLTATLNDSQAARDFAAQLPLTLTLTDYSKTEKISDVIPIQQVNEACEQLLKSDVKYRFCIDLASLRA